MGAADSRALLQQAQTALEAGDWDEARARFGRVLALGDSAEARAGLAQALQWLGLFDAAIDARERAFAAFRDRRMPLEASQQARWLAFLHGAVNGNTAAAMGWFARAEALLDGLDESVEHGWLAFDRAPLVQDRGERRRLADSAVRIGRAHGDLDLECGALALLGESYVYSGRIAEGMKPIDQAMAAVSSGEVRAVVTAGDVYCRLLSARERTGDVRRAEQWMAVAEGFAAWSGYALVSTTCRMHYGAILTEIGQWREAEESSWRPSASRSGATAGCAPSHSSGLPSCASDKGASKKPSRAISQSPKVSLRVPVRRRRERQDPPM